MYKISPFFKQTAQLFMQLFKSEDLMQILVLCDTKRGSM